MLNKAPNSSSLAERIADIVGSRYVVTDPADMHPHLIEQRDLYQGRAAMVVKPANTEEVAAIMRLAAETGAAIVPQGGNTGLVGGQIAADEAAVVLSLSRLDRIRAVDAAGNTLIAEAGVTLGRIREAAGEADRLFPLSLPSEGSCQIGGNLSTNAGGTAVLAYGNSRDLVLGLEVVLADGRIWNGLRSLRKDNTGYDLKHLFVGAEGTLGIITAAVLKLFPKPKARETVIAGLPNAQAAIDLLNLAQGAGGASLTTFELMPRIGIEFVVRHAHGARDPLAEPHPWYVLAEFTSGVADADLRGLSETVFGEAVERGLVTDAAFAESLDQSRAFWTLREMLSEVQRHEGGSIKQDVSVPVSKVAAFIEEASEAALKVAPGARPVPFGHVGDGNVHFNISQPEGADRAEFLAKWDAVNDAVHEIVAKYSGSISAEHGIGVMKRHLLPHVKGEVEMDMMRRIKQALDPQGILNPGKVL